MTTSFTHFRKKFKSGYFVNTSLGYLHLYDPQNGYFHVIHFLIHCKLFLVRTISGNRRLRISRESFNTQLWIMPERKEFLRPFSAWHPTFCILRFVLLLQSDIHSWQSCWQHEVGVMGYTIDNTINKQIIITKKRYIMINFAVIFYTLYVSGTRCKEMTRKFLLNILYL